MILTVIGFLYLLLPSQFLSVVIWIVQILLEFAPGITLRLLESIPTASLISQSLATENTIESIANSCRFCLVSD